MFQPNTYDNNKLLYAAYFLVCGVVASYMVEIYRRLRTLPGRRALAVGALVLCTLSAVLTIGRDEVVNAEDGTVTTAELPGLTRGAGIWISPESYPELGAQSVIANHGLTTDGSEFADDYSVFFHTDADKYECVTVKTTTGEGDDAVTTRKVVS